MDMCYNNHEEVVVENSRYCPLCETLERIADLEKTISQLEDEITWLNKEIK